MIERTGATLNFWLARCKHWASLWTITRADGVVFRFTSNDQIIEHPRGSGLTFTPAGGFDGSARQRVDGLKDHTVDFIGLITSDNITAADLRAGRFREAKVTEEIVDARWPWQGVLFSETWWVDQTTLDSEIWTAELSGPSRFLKRKIGDIAARNCDRKLYSSLCGVARATFTVSDVAAIGCEDGERKLVIFADPASLPTQADDYYAYGDVIFTSGMNDGLVQNVKSYRDSDRRIELQGPMPFPIAAGDTFDLAAGCDLLRATCRDKFSNLVNGSMFAFMPGSDRVLQTTPTR